MDVLRFRQFGNITNCEGLLHFEGDHLRLEYQVVDPLVGILKSDVKEVDIALADLASITLEKGWFGGSKLVLQAKGMAAVRAVPGMSQGRVELAINRDDRQVAERLVEGLGKPVNLDHTGLDV